MFVWIVSFYIIKIVLFNFNINKTMIMLKAVHVVNVYLIQ